MTIKTKILNPVKVKCKICKCVFNVFPYRTKIVKYCSRVCQFKSYKGQRHSPKTEFKKGVIPKTAFKKGSTGEKSINWKGDKAGYHALHKWIYQQKGAPMLCEICGDISLRKYEWANKDHKYKRRIEDYIRMCTPCHRHYDYTNLKPNGTINKK